MPPDILVISLPDSTDRRLDVARQLDATGLPYAFFDGINGRKENHVINDYYDEDLRLLRKGSPLSPGQLGCFASHYALWQKAASENRAILVLEDDLQIDGERLKSFYQQADTLPESLECIRLFDNTTRAHRSIPVSKHGEFTVYKYTKGPMGSWGYLITPAGATKLLTHIKPVTFAIDIYMDRFWLHKMECYGIHPPCVGHNIAFGSTIGYNRTRPCRPMKVKLLREAFNLTEKIHRFIHNLGFRIQHVRNKTS